MCTYKFAIRFNLSNNFNSNIFRIKNMDSMIDPGMDTTIDPSMDSKFEQSMDESYENYGSFELDMAQETTSTRGPKSVHQCDVCNKIFVSLKGNPDIYE